MVNAGLKRAASAASPRYGTAKIRIKYEVFSVNESFSKRFKFAKNFPLIRFECAQKREQPLQACLLGCVMRRNQNSRPPAF